MVDRRYSGNYKPVAERLMAKIRFDPETHCMIFTGSVCERCDSCGWTCEQHPHHPWNGISTRADACHHGAGVPCPDCNPKSTEYRVHHADLPAMAPAVRQPVNGTSD